MILAAKVDIRVSYILNQDGEIDDREINIPKISYDPPGFGLNIALIKILIIFETKHQSVSVGSDL